MPSRHCWIFARKRNSGSEKRKIVGYFDILMDKNKTKGVIKYIAEHQQYRGWGWMMGTISASGWPNNISEKW